jgi:hypothetical protein
MFLLHLSRGIFDRFLFANVSEVLCSGTGPSLRGEISARPRIISWLMSMHMSISQIPSYGLDAQSKLEAQMKSMV